MGISNQHLHIQKLEFSNGSLEALKWLALLLMTADHINHFLLNFQLPMMYNAGRVAMPIFGFVLAYNLTRANALQSGIVIRTMKRLLIFGLLATPFYGLLYRWMPVNIMFMLLLVTYLIYILENNQKYKWFIFIFVFFIIGIFVEYAWFGIAYCLAAWWFCKSPGLLRMLVWIASTALLAVVNLNYWACAAIPLILLATKVRFNFPRLRYVFYAYYPIHLALLLYIQKNLR